MSLSNSGSTPSPPTQPTPSSPTQPTPSSPTQPTPSSPTQPPSSPLPSSGLPSLPAAAAMSHPTSTNPPSSTSHVRSTAPPLFIPRPPPTSISRPVNRAYTRRRIPISPCNSPTPGGSGSTPNESDIPSSGGQLNLPDDDGEDEVDSPVVATAGKRGRGGIASGRGRGAASKPTKRRKY